MITPQYQVIANDGDITDKIAGRLIDLSLTDEAGTKSDTLEIRLADHDPANPIQIPKAGAELRVSLGYAETGMRAMGLFIADEFELSGWPGELVIRARAAVNEQTPKGKTGIQSQKTRSWPSGTTLGSMTRKIATDNGLQAVVAQSLASIELPHVDQTDESDINLLIRMARKYDAIAKPAGGKLVLAKRGESKAASGQAIPAVTIDASQVTSWRLVIAKKEKAGRVIAYWHDMGAAERKGETVGSGDPVVRLRHTYPSQAQAKQAAQAHRNSRARGEQKLTLTMPGDSSLTAEARLTLTGFRDGVNGEWLVTSVVHGFSPSSGYSCTVDAEHPN